MAGRSRIKLNTAFQDEFTVEDSAGAPVAGLVQGNFTFVVYNPSGSEVSGAVTFSITELGNGLYRVQFTPNALGEWVCVIFHATYFTWGKSANYFCETRAGDDHAIEANVETHATASLTSYDPPTRAEATTDKDTIIAEVDANEAKIDNLDGDLITVGAAIVAEIDANETKIDALPTAAAIADAVLEEALADHSGAGSLSEAITMLRKMEVGRWKIDTGANTMTFYDTDGTSPLLVFDLKDSAGSAAYDNVFERDPQ